MTPGIYIIHNTKNGRVYIGQTIDTRIRLAAHKYKLADKSHHNRKLQADWNLHGEKVFTFKVLEYCELDQLTPREQHYLDIYMPRGICYNTARIACSPRDGHSTREKKPHSHSRNLTTIWARGDKEWKARVHAHAISIGMSMTDFVTKVLLSDLEARGL